jgi:hypothetical protein
MLMNQAVDCECMTDVGPRNGFAVGAQFVWSRRVGSGGYELATGRVQ